MFDGYHRPSHLEPFLDEVAKLFANPKQPSLVFSAPPRFSKTDTLLCAVLLYMLRYPGREVVWASATKILAGAKSHKARDLAVLHGFKTRSHPTIAGAWSLENGSTWYVAGVDSTIIGFGFHLGIMDDPVESRQAAESPAQRAALLSWFQGVFRGRGNPGASIIATMHRWNHDDIFAYFKGLKGWRYMSLPALNENGESNAPWLYTTAELNQIHHDVKDYDWDSLYMQNPGKQKSLTVYAVGDKSFWKPRTPPKKARKDWHFLCGLAVNMDTFGLVVGMYKEHNQRLYILRQHHGGWSDMRDIAKAVDRYTRELPSIGQVIHTRLGEEFVDTFNAECEYGFSEVNASRLGHIALFGADLENNRVLMDEGSPLHEELTRLVWEDQRKEKFDRDCASDISSAAICAWAHSLHRMTTPKTKPLREGSPEYWADWDDREFERAVARKREQNPDEPFETFSELL